MKNFKKFKNSKKSEIWNVFKNSIIEKTDKNRSLRDKPIDAFGPEETKKFKTPRDFCPSWSFGDFSKR